ncbi:MAG: DUF4282 domain-containing protein [Planctomycetota bacterium]|nr:MAG: DUF4282 domain-containing protein [Planctomycetota bacterium]REJ91852.1 MAG: DUF4282 domain-containing protein [Planctomycetota bacterium]REK25237.1 MAG: DUF4282 domain-containing protein [Planctomycetota bacterium]REK34670.1 MAG: DUF4282 domain-containing protein [Planctomycetota bacterium]
MAVPRYQWQCPRCGRQFAIKVGLDPSLCPECEADSSEPAAEQTESMQPVSAAPPQAPNARLTEHRPSRKPIPLLAALDVEFQRRFTPRIVSVCWTVGLLLTAAWVATASVALFTSAMETGVHTPQELLPVAWEFGRIVLQALAALVTLRLLGEVLVSITRIEESLAEHRTGAPSE